MTKQQAITAMLNGKAIRHKLFAPGEYITIGEHEMITDEQGFLHPDFWLYRQGKLWEEDWEVCLIQCHCDTEDEREDCYAQCDYGTSETQKTVLLQVVTSLFFNKLTPLLVRGRGSSSMYAIKKLAVTGICGPQNGYVTAKKCFSDVTKKAVTFVTKSTKKSCNSIAVNVSACNKIFKNPPKTAILLHFCYILLQLVTSLLQHFVTRLNNYYTISYKIL